MLLAAAEFFTRKATADFIRYGLAHGFDALTQAPVVEHTACDNPLCQNPAHLSPSTVTDNTGSGATRRHNLAGPLRDPSKPPA